MKRVVSYLIIVLVMLGLVEVNASNYEMMELIPLDVETTIRGDNFLYKDISYEKGSIKFGSIKNMSDEKKSLTVSIGLFNKKKKNIGIINYCSTEDALDANDFVENFSISITKEYLGKDYSIDDVKYIAILNDKAITLYNSYGEKISKIDNVDINSALFDSSDRYLAIAENKGHELCLVLDKTYLWNTAIEGEILQIHVNQNGYVAVVTTDVTNKSIITCYNSEGKKLFASYFATTTIIDASISNNNKNIVIGEVDTSGTIIKSSIKVTNENDKQD